MIDSRGLFPQGWWLRQKVRSPRHFLDVLTVLALHGAREGFAGDGRHFHVLHPCIRTAATDARPQTEHEANQEDTMGTAHRRPPKMNTDASGLLAKIGEIVNLAVSHA